MFRLLQQPFMKPSAYITHNAAQPAAYSFISLKAGS